MSACIDFGRGCVDQWTIDVENPQGAILIEGHAGLNLSERILGHEKRSFHRAVMSPEPYGPPCGIIAAATIWKSQGHGINPARSEPPGYGQLRTQKPYIERRQAAWSRIQSALQSQAGMPRSTPCRSPHPLEAHASTGRHCKRRSILVRELSHHRFGGDKQTSDRCCAL
jgi:hypothetical protein